MRVKRYQARLLSRVGESCPLCGTRIARSRYFCDHCGRSGRVHIGPEEVRERRRELYLPRELIR
jgi:predicted amidophosphoribosyltransferase